MAEKVGLLTSVRVMVKPTRMCTETVSSERILKLSDKQMKLKTYFLSEIVSRFGRRLLHLSFWCIKMLKTSVTCKRNIPRLRMGKVMWFAVEIPNTCYENNISLQHHPFAT